VAVVRDRIGAYDAGVETQEMQRHVLEWMEEAVKGLTLKAAEADPEKSPEWAWDGFAAAESPRGGGKRAEVGLIIMLQERVNARVKILSAKLRETPDSATVRQDLRRAIDMQGSVLAAIAELVEKDDIRAVAGQMYMPH
jgi:hypothetical protein